MKIESHRRGNPRTLAAVAGAATLAALAAFNIQRAHAAERRHPPNGRRLSVDGVRLHYYEQGRGEPLVLLHGNGSGLNDFVGSGLVHLLARRFRVIAFDRPGYGHSTRPRDRLWTPRAQAALIAQACRMLHVARPTVVGHSWGTLVALELALGGELDVRSLALLSGYYYPTPRFDALWQAPPAVPIVGDAMRFTVSPIASRLVLPAMLRTMFSPRIPDPRFLAAVPKSMIVRPSQLKASGEDSAFMMPGAAALVRRYGELRIPVTIVAGREDRMVKPSAHAQRLAAELPDAKLHLLRDVGHMVHYAFPREIARMIEDGLPAVDVVTQALPSARLRPPPMPVQDASTTRASTKPS